MNYLASYPSKRYTIHIAVLLAIGMQGMVAPVFARLESTGSKLELKSRSDIIVTTIAEI